MRDLILINGQWQGAGRLNRIPSGAQVIEYILGDRDFKRVSIDCRVLLEREQGVRGLSSLVANARQTRDLLEHHSFDRIFNLGGDCGSDLVPISFLNERLNGELVLIWFDAHADLNTPESSPSGSFHGMVLRTLLGDGPEAFAGFVPKPLEPSVVHLVGVRDLDEAETEFIKRCNLSCHSSNIEEVVHAVIKSVATPRSVYIHVDYDVLDEAEYSDISFPTPGGVSINNLVHALQTLRSQFNTEVVGMSLTEYSPAEPAKPSASLMRLLQDGFGL